MLEDVPAEVFAEQKVWRVTDSYTLLNNFAFGKIAAKQHLTG